jgi:TRAP-type mannitol/chloroaromatic compound transport system permease small subunit
VAPIFFWVVVPYVIDLCAHYKDRELASSQARAVLEDRMHLFSLIPTVVVIALTIILVTLLVLLGVSVAMGRDLFGNVSDWVLELNPSKFALVGSAYFLIGAASAAHVYRPVFLSGRKRLLDRAWIHKYALQKDSRN